MTEIQESTTAKLCSFARAYHSNMDRQKIFDDYLAYDLMGKEAYEEIGQLIDNDFEAGKSDANYAFSSAKIAEKLNRYIMPIPLSRIAFAENKLLEFAREHGKCQYVVCRAGMDTFAFRNDNADIHVFELDHPNTGRYKRERVRQLEWNMSLVDRVVKMNDDEAFAGARELAEKRESLPARPRARRWRRQKS